MPQKEVTTIVDILDSNGELANSGWARDDFFVYNRQKVRSNPLRIKAWDYWEVFNDKFRVILNIFDIGYAGVAQFSFLDFETEETTNAMLFRPFPMGAVGNPPRWRYEEPLVFQKGYSRMEFRRNDCGDIILNVRFPGKNISGEIKLGYDETMDSVVNVIPFQNTRHFVYAIKVLCLPARGSINIKGKEYEFSQSNNSWGILDWTRAVFPYKNSWKWCAASGLVDGKPFGFNIDYGFGTESDKSMIVYEGKGHHLGKVEYRQDRKFLMKPVEIKAADGRVNLLLTPLYAEKTRTSLGFLEMKGIKSYGYFTGKTVLDDGSIIEIKPEDKLFGWAEEFFQKW